MVELLFPRTLSEDMKDVFILPRGLGLRGVEQKIKNVTFLNLLMYLVYYGFPTLSTPKIDTHPGCSAHMKDTFVPCLSLPGIELVPNPHHASIS